MFTYLDDLPELPEEDLDEDHHYLSIHYDNLPEVGLGLPVTVVEEPVLGLDFEQLEIVPSLIDKDEGHSRDTQAPQYQGWQCDTQSIEVVLA